MAVKFEPLAGTSFLPDYVFTAPVQAEKLREKGIVDFEHFRAFITDGPGGHLVFTDDEGAFCELCKEEAPTESDERWNLPCVETSKEAHIVDVGAAVIQEEGSGYYDVYYDTSACSPLDTYDKKEGFKRAMRRAFSQVFHDGTPRGKVDRWRWTGSGVVDNSLQGVALRDAVRQLVEIDTNLSLSRNLTCYPGTFPSNEIVKQAEG